ncbi:hypothetical protein MKW94_001062 [Papaver nudicaule]|uniref:Uncharacterized protein n=1 Tax=Papaver nudicaule TaxID=74823 RepID=A0AA41SFS4_PAPNU|nr:hypothetical protein [Papaver nudicaule]
MSEFDILQENHPQDVLWLSLLSEKELDVLILLKSLVIERAKYVGHEHVANKYDLKMLRKLYCRLMKHLKGRIERTPSISGTELLKGINTSDMKGTNSSEIALLEEVIAPIMAKSSKGKNSTRTTSNDVGSISRNLIFALRSLRNSGF